MKDVLLQIHSGSWGILIILFLISVIFPKQKISLMLQRLFYLVMLVTGVWMLILMHFPKQYDVKGILALILMATMELIVANRRRGRPTIIAWILFVVLLIVILLLAYKIVRIG